MLYADEAAAKYVKGMVAPGYGLNGMGNIFETIGLKSTYTQKRAGEGANLAQVFQEYANSLDYNMARIERIPKGSAQDNLRKTAGPAITLRNGLEPMFAPGATPGSKDAANVNAMVAQVKQLAKEVEAAEKLYGISAPLDPATVTRAGGAQMSFLNIPLWGWALAGLAGALLAKKLKGKGRRK